MNGIWCGEHATVAIVDDFHIAFLRIKKDVIASILYHKNYGTIGAVYGLGINFKATAEYCTKNPETGTYFYNVPNGKMHLENHARDKIQLNIETQKLIYTMFDGTAYELILAGKINMDDFNRKNPVDKTISIAKRMALWGVQYYFEYLDGYFHVGIVTEKYSIYYNISVSEKYVYCRVGQNGYSEKGRAMLSTTCIRQNECRMIENNLMTLNDYKPIEDCFVVDRCAFPPDGGWYWSIKEVSDDVIYLNGCGGVTYEIHRR
jgi:hypothetical protein